MFKSDELFNRYQTSSSGLNSEEVKERLEKHGLNSIDTSKKRSALMEFFDQFKSPLVLILLAAVLIAFFAGEEKEAIVIFTVVMANALIGFIQQYRSEKTVEALKKMISYKARVLRDGEEIEIDARYVVPGDIIFLYEGNTVPADAVVLSSNVLKVDEAVLTGESVPVIKYSIDEYRGEKLEMTKLSMGTVCLMGSGKALVTETGLNTKFGEIAKIVSQTENEKTPIQIELEHIGVFVGKAVLVVSGSLFLVNYFLFNKSFLENILFAVSIAVAAVPEGLPATITIALALGVKSMAKHKAIIKKLSSVETLGSISVICSDKTGTLTKNELTVKEVYLASKEKFHVHGVGYNPTKPKISQGHLDEDMKELSNSVYPLALSKLVDIFHFCNDSKLQRIDTQYRILGDPTEGALHVAAQKCKDFFNQDYSLGEKVFEVPFNSDRKRMSVVVKGDSKFTVYAKGAVSVLLEHCTHYFDGKEVVPLNLEKRKEILEMDETYALEGMRVMGFAYKEMDSFTKPRNSLEIDVIEERLVFIGLTGMIDPPRMEIKEAVAICKKAGVKVYVITGDHPLTAKAIAKQLGIFSKDKPIELVTGDKLGHMNDSEIASLLTWESNVIFARVDPVHKMRIVSILKKMGERVAVTGDGVNDAPALKSADIGISMGITGTDVAKEASDVILTDDSFASIVAAIRQGRRIYENMKKFVWFVFSTNIGELVIIFLGLLLGFPAPLTAVLILLINLGTDMFPAIALGVEPEESDLISHPPRDPKSKIMNKEFIMHFATNGAFIGLVALMGYVKTLFDYGWSFGQPLLEDDFAYMHATTVAFALLVFMELANSFNAKSFEHSAIGKHMFNNRYLLMALTLSTCLVLFISYVPLGQYWFNTAPLTLADWVLIGISSVLTILFEEGRKGWRNYKRKYGKGYQLFPLEGRVVQRKK